MSELKQMPVSAMLLPNGSVSCFNGKGESVGGLSKQWIVVWLEWLEAKGVSPLEVGKIETIINGELVRIKPFKEGGFWGYDTIVLKNYSAHRYERAIELNQTFSLIGFDSEDEMVSWIQGWNSMDGEDAPPFFSECGAYHGSVKDCESKEEWMERKGKMESGAYWYKSYDGDVYCKNHYGWAFESAIKVIGNPQYIIVLDKSKINQ